ncbi:hypothetical protein BG005_008074 [Podila minutissima]|nr:hypothetical protein BG005_008074 [Podila minutissima]
MLSPIQSYFGSDPNSIASAFSLPRHDHYPRPSDDPQSTAGPADGYHGQDLLQDDQDLEDGDNAMGESYDCQESILQSEDDTELLDDEDDEDDESYPYGYSGTELDDELYEPCGPEEDGDSDMDDQGSESLLLEEEDTSVSYNPRIADFDSSSTAGRHVADTFIEDDDVGNALAHVLGLGRLEDDRLAGTLHHASSDSPRQSIAPISDEFSALVGTAVS